MIWLGLEMKWFGERASTLRLDWSAQHWAVAYLPYLIVQFTGYWYVSYSVLCNPLSLTSPKQVSDVDVLAAWCLQLRHRCQRSIVSPFSPLLLSSPSH